MNDEWKNRKFRLFSECVKFHIGNIRFYECMIHIKVGRTKNTDRHGLNSSKLEIV